MRAKITTYILLCALIVIWGTIVYKVIFSKKDSKVQLAEPCQITTKKSLYEITDSTQNRRDPFFFVEQNVMNSSNNTNEPLHAEPEAINFQYIAKIGAKKKVRYIVIIDGEETEMKIGDIFNDIKLIKANEDFITVTFKGHTYEARIHQE